MAPMIGIKIANGEFYPILAQNTAANKRLVLTTANDGQKSVQIDLYKSDNKSIKDAVYIGTLLVENIQNKKKGDPSIELDIKMDDEGVISAAAFDKDDDGLDKQNTLSVSLKSIEKKEGDLDIPDFDIDDGTENIIEVKAVGHNGGSKKLLLIILAAVLSLLLAAGALYLFILAPGT